MTFVKFVLDSFETERLACDSTQKCFTYLKRFKFETNVFQLQDADNPKTVVCSLR